MGTENKSEKLMKLFLFLEETRCKLSISQISIIPVIEIYVLEIYPDLTFTYNLKENLEEVVKKFIKEGDDNRIDKIYSENHFFVDYCVDKGWVKRTEIIKHHINRDMEES